MAIIHSLKCTVPFSFIVPLAATCCHSLSFVVTRCHSLSLVVIRCVVTRCHSLSLVVTRCTTHLSFHKRSIIFDERNIYALLFNFRQVVHISSFRIVNLLCCRCHFTTIAFIDAKTKYRRPYLLEVSWPYL